MPCKDADGKKALDSLRGTYAICDQMKIQYNTNAKNAGKSSKTIWDTDILIDDIKDHIWKGIAYHENQPRAVSNWCTAVKPILTTFKTQKLTNGSPAKDPLRVAFVNGENIVNIAQNNRLISFNGAKVATDELAAIKLRFDDLAKTASAKLPVEDLMKKHASVQQPLTDLMCAELQFNSDCHELREQFDRTRMYLWVDDVLTNQNRTTESMDQLIDKCDKFISKYQY